jgi:predicted ribosomally synthesized peptide with SipW-like signal peptide
MSSKTRKFAGVIASIAVGISLVGAGTYASFSDSAQATDKIAVGTMGVSIDPASVPAAAVLAPSGCLGTLTSKCTSVTLDTSATPITSSAAGSQALPFKVKNVGNIAINALHIVSAPSGMTYTGSPFSDMLNPVPADQGLAVGAEASFNGGISWTALGNGDEGKTVSVQYTVSATQ